MIPTIKPDSENFGAVLNCAVRYCIGRQSYMPSLVIDFITPLLPYLSDGALRCFEKDLSETKNFGDAMIDKPAWMRFKADVMNEREKRGIKDDCK